MESVVRRTVSSPPAPGLTSLFSWGSSLRYRLRVRGRAAAASSCCLFHSSNGYGGGYGLTRISRSKERRVVVRRAGLTTSNIVFAFVFPLSLILITVLASINIADKLDKEYLEELAKNEALMEEQDDTESSPALTEEKPALPSKRNRPKRVA